MIGVKFTDLTDEQQSIIEKYGISSFAIWWCKERYKICYNWYEFLGERPLSVEWINMPILKFKDGKEEQAEEDGYSFKVEVVDGTGEVVDNGAKGNSSNQVIGHLTMKKLKRLVTLLWTIAKIKMPLDLKNPHPMKIQIFGPFLQQLDAAIFHMEIQIILTMVCKYQRVFAVT